MMYFFLFVVIIFTQSALAAEYTVEDHELFNKALLLNQQGGHKKAFEIYTSLAEKGHADAENNLGYMYKSGVGTKQNYQKAVELYQRSANQDYVHAQVNLAFMYSSGSGVQQDYSKALFWFRRAAEHDFALAHYNLGVYYYNGIGVEANNQTAMSHFHKACINNHTESCFIYAELNGEKKAYNTYEP